MFQKYILENRRNIVSSVCDLITFPSISEETNNSHFPFGKACSDSLKYFLSLASSLGFRTKNVDGYCGFAEFGEGEELIGIIGHLDVVPAKDEDWSYSPFVPTISNNCIYGRGAMDDKGPVIASLYAMKAVMDYLKENNIAIKKRVRLIVGLNEEKDWKCIDYYKKHEEIPTLGFSPDSDFPCIYAEKSVISLQLCEKLSEIQYTLRNRLSMQESQLSIEEIDCNQNAINVVPKFCSVTLFLKDSKYMSELISTCKQTIEECDYDIDLYKIDEHHLKISSYGIASHSAHPELGKNAISKLIIVISHIFSKWHISFPLFEDFCKLIGDDYTGKNMELNIKDESGALTLNPSQLFIKDNKVCISINLRVPVHTKPEEVIEKFKEKFSCEVSVLRIQPALYIEKDNFLVQKLCSIFNEACNSHFEPIAIGGATYARAFPNCICFGMNFPKDKDMCHQADEFVEINKLILSCNIYAKAIYELLQPFDSSSNTTISENG